MTVAVERVGRAQAGRRGHHYTLEQRFRLGTSAERIATILLAEPLVGAGSVFGKRPGSEGAAAEGERHLRGFSPASMFRFDMRLRRVAPGIFVVQFSQPDRVTPYLSGELVWFLEDDTEGAVFDEQINTPRALEHAREPLGGAPRSLRRWIFFHVGHKQVMDVMMSNIATIA
jgi:hypothetical protein